MKKYILICLVLLVCGYIGYTYLNKAQRNISTEKSSFGLTSATLVSDLKKGDIFFNNKYLDKTMEISGLVTTIDIENNAAELDVNIFATFVGKIPADLKIKQNAVIKARFIGYDDLLEIFKFDQATIVN